MQGNATICLILSRTKEKVITKVDSTEIENSQSKELSEITTYSQLSFEKHVNNICGKAKAKLSPLSWVAPTII